MVYETVIGLEVHIQLNVNTKLFSSATTQFGQAPNTQTSVLCLALPGALPVLNREALYKAVLAGISLKGTIHLNSRFDRKHYFYPDLPKGYQISQFYEPYCTKAEIIIHDGKQAKTIEITRIHMEEDAGKLIHSENPSLPESYVDLNRAGTPLIEIVSEPMISSPQEAYLYLHELKHIMEYINISDCNMEEGSLRCDANVSVRPVGTSKLGNRVEIKNLNTFKGVKQALEYEIERQTSTLENGDTVAQETRLWDAASQKTLPMRSKEESFDYRYFPDPDLTPIKLTQEEIETIRQSMPELAREKQKRFIAEYQLSEYDASILTAQKETAQYFEEVLQLHKIPPKKVANWIITEMMSALKSKKQGLYSLFPPSFLGFLVHKVENGDLSGKMAKVVFAEMLETSKKPEQIIQEKNLLQITDTKEIGIIVQGVIDENPETVKMFLNGKDRVLGHLVGQVMKKTQGKANPSTVNKLIMEKIKA